MLKVAYSPIYKYSLPPGHRFPMIKYELLPEQLLLEGTISESNIFDPPPLDDETILLTHDRDYWTRLQQLSLSPKEIQKIGFPLSGNLVQRGRHIANGTIQCALFALEYGVAMNIAGGTHHSFADRGEGFCLLNDIAIAANYLLKEKLAEQILIIDLDVHQGNGTANIFMTESRVFTFSMHGAKNYPVRKERSDLDIELQDKTTDEYYLKTLKEVLPMLIDRVQPDFIFYLSGVDVLETDQLGRLSLTLAGCKERDQLVFTHCKLNRIPVAVSMGGGYSARLTHIIEAHANTYRSAVDLYF